MNSVRGCNGEYGTETGQVTIACGKDGHMYKPESYAHGWKGGAERGAWPRSGVSGKAS